MPLAAPVIKTCFSVAVPVFEMAGLADNTGAVSKKLGHEKIVSLKNPEPPHRFLQAEGRRGKIPIGAANVKGC